MTNVKTLNDLKLVEKLKFLVAEELKNISAQIVLLREVRKRKLALTMGYPNLLEFCAHELGLTRDQAWKRSQAAGAVEQQPELLDMLLKGQTNLSALAVVSPKLTEKTAQEIKEFLPNRSKREVEAFVSTLNRDGTRQEKPATVKLTLNLSLDTLSKLDRARKILNQNRTETSQEDVIDAALELLLDKKDPVRKSARAMVKAKAKANANANANAKTENPANKPNKPNNKSKLSKTSPGQLKAKTIESKHTSPRKRAIPARIKHQLNSSNNYRCQFIGTNGQRCRETRALQIDHIQMYCKGGGHDVKNLRLMCPAHNRLLAEKELGWSYLDLIAK